MQDRKLKFSGFLYLIYCSNLANSYKFWDGLCPGLHDLTWNDSPTRHLSGKKHWSYVKMWIIFMCSVIAISFRKLHTYVLSCRLTRKVHPCMRVFEMLVRDWGNRILYWRSLPSEGNMRRSDFDNWNLFKLKTAYFEYWTSIKIKINMDCVSKEYEI